MLINFDKCFIPEIDLIRILVQLKFEYLIAGRNELSELSSFLKMKGCK